MAILGDKMSKIANQNLIRMIIKEMIFLEKDEGGINLYGGGRGVALPASKQPKSIPFEYDDRFYERILSDELCSPVFKIDTIYEARLDTISVDVLGKIDDKNFLVTSTNKNDEFNKIFNNLGGIKITDSDLSPSGRVNSFFTKQFPNVNVRDRKLKIAKAKSSEDIKKSSIINPELEFFAIISCTNPDFFVMRKIETMSDITGFASYFIANPIKTYRDVGKRIAELPDATEQSIIKWYNGITSILGIADIFVGRGVLGAAAIGPLLVLASYYKYALPNEKIFGIPASAFYTVCAALGGIGTYGKIAAATSTGKEISDLAILAKEFSSIRSAAGMTELGLVTADDAAKLARPLTGAYNASSLETLLAFCRRFPELQRAQNFTETTRGFSSAITILDDVAGYWTQVGKMWTWTAKGGKVLTNPSTGKAILFSDDVRSMIIFAAEHPNSIVRYVEWHNMMPGAFGKAMITAGFVGDSYVISNILTTIEGEIGEIPKGQRIDNTNIETQKVDDIKYDYYTKLLNRDSNLKILMAGGKGGLTSLYNLDTRENKDVSRFYVIAPTIGTAVTMHSSNKNADLSDLSSCKLLIVDDSIYDNFDLLMKAPINLERRIKSGQVIAFKHAPGVYSLVQKDTVIKIMNENR